MPVSATLANDLAAILRAARAHHAAGRLAEARQHYEQARKLDPQDPEVLHGLGLIAWQTDAHAEADALISAAIVRDGTKAPYHDHHGLVLAGFGRVAQAEAAHLRAIFIDPNLAAARNNLAMLLRTHGRAAEALPHADHAIALEPGNPTFHVNRGETLVALGRAGDAAESFAAAIRAKPDCADAYFALGQLWQRTGNLEGARFALRSYLKLDPADQHGARPLLALADPQAEMPETYSAAYIRNLFDSYAGRFEAHLTGKLQYRGPELLRAAVARVDPSDAPRDVLDLGCGTGLAGIAFKPLARKLVGVDLSAGMLEQARARAIYDELVLDDVVAVAARSPGAYDLILAADVFIYVGALEPIMRAMHAALRPVGLAAFTVELNDDGRPVRVLPSRRFGHDRAAVAQLARDADFAVALDEAITLRIEAGQPVAGALFVLRRPA